MPTATVIGFLVNPTNPNSVPETEDVQAAARALGKQLHVQNASKVHDVDAAFVNFAKRLIDALSVAADAFFLTQRDEVVQLAARDAIPTIYARREFVAAGGLASYGPQPAEADRQAGVYAGRILKGERPADLPVIQSSKFQLVINLKTAKTLGLAGDPAAAR